MQSIIDQMNQAIRLEPEEARLIRDAFQPMDLKKNEAWIQQGEICAKIAFVESGTLRVFYYDTSGTEINCYFVQHDQFISSLTSFLTETPTLENIVAIEDSKIWTISKQDLESLSEAVPKIHIWRRIIAENLFIMMEKRIAMLQSQNASQRYEQLLKENPEIIQTIPLQYTASFLGMTPQHLSRLRKKTES